MILIWDDGTSKWVQPTSEELDSIRESLVRHEEPKIHLARVVLDPLELVGLSLTSQPVDYIREIEQRI